MKKSTKKLIKKIAKSAYENTKETVQEVGSYVGKGVKQVFTEPMGYDNTDNNQVNAYKRQLKAQRDRLESLRLQQEINQLQSQIKPSKTKAQAFTQGAQSKLDESFGLGSRQKRINPKAVNRIKAKPFLQPRKSLELGWGGF